MSVYSECPYCRASYKPREGEHKCSVEDLKRHIDDLEERLREWEDRVEEPDYRV